MMRGKNNAAFRGAQALALAVAVLAAALGTAPAWAEDAPKDQPAKNAILADTLSGIMPYSTLITRPVFEGFCILGIEYQRALAVGAVADATVAAGMLSEQGSDLALFYYGGGAGIRAPFLRRGLDGPYARLGGLVMVSKYTYLNVDLSVGLEYVTPWGFVIDNRAGVTYTVGGMIPMFFADLLMIGISF